MFVHASCMLEHLVGLLGDSRDEMLSIDSYHSYHTKLTNFSRTLISKTYSFSGVSALVWTDSPSLTLV